MRYLIWSLFLTLLAVGEANASPLLVKNDLFKQAKEDYQVFYTGKGTLGLINGLAVGGILANSNWDSTLEHYWQKHLRNGTSNQFSQAIDDYALYVHPQYVLFLALIPNLNEELWLNHYFRSLILGLPQQVFLTHFLGGNRPEQGNSHWHFLHHNRSVSGHAFYGALPFINYALVQEHPVIKTGALLASILPALARINSDKHYASQAFLGWWLAFNCAYFIYHRDQVSDKPNRIYYQFIPTHNTINLAVTMNF